MERVLIKRTRPLSQTGTYEMVRSSDPPPQTHSGYPTACIVRPTTEPVGADRHTPRRGERRPNPLAPPPADDGADCPAICRTNTETRRSVAVGRVSVKFIAFTPCCLSPMRPEMRMIRVEFAPIRTTATGPRRTTSAMTICDKAVSAKRN